MRKLFFGLLALLLLAPQATLAAESTFFGPIVPTECQSCPCGFAGVLEIMRHLMNFAVTLGVVVLTIMIAYAGLMYILSAANPESRSKANQMVTGAVIGIILVLCSWLIIDFVMRMLYSGPDGTGGKFGPWNSILAQDADWCIVAMETQPLFNNIPFSPGTGPTPNPNNPNPNPGTGGTGGTTGCPTCVSLTEKGLTCSNSKSCTATPALASKLSALKGEFSGSWTVTEGYPPTRTHRAECHRQGTCVDIGFRGQTAYNSTNVSAFVNASKKAGLRAVFETTNCDLRDTVRKAGFQAFCRADGGGYEKISGNHFSVYGN